MTVSERRRTARPEREGLARRREAAVPAAGPAPRRPQPASARRVALDVLDLTLGPLHRPFDEAFDAHPQLERLAQRDRGFARLLVATTLRRLGEIDRLVAPLLRYRPKELSVQNLLRLGAAQLLFLGTPAHAAVGETVRLAAQRFARQAPLLNAVLRKLAAQGTAALAGQDEARLNTPRWLWDSWVAAYGEEAARAIAAAHLHEPPLDLHPLRDREHWARELGAELLPLGILRRRGGGLIERLPGFEEGAWWVQDVAAALPVVLLGEVAGRRIADLCAAPGGKTAQLCAAGARVTAVERSPKRAAVLAGNLARLGFAPEIITADVLDWQPEEPLDMVLLDAPCTATGTIRRHPDVPWHKGPDDVRRLAEVQGRLLARATELVRPGGRLVYAVCSLQPEEGEEIIAQAVADRRLVREPVRPAELQGLEATVDPLGQVRTFPSSLAASGGLDGFFIARLRREG